MKILTVLTLINILALSSVAQQKKDSKIIVTVSDTTNLLNKVAAVFYQRGYVLDQKDQDVKFVATQEKELKRWNAVAKYRALIKDSTIILSGSVAFNFDFNFGGAVSKKSFSDIYFGGEKKSALRESWEEMDAIAKQIGGSVSYSK